MGPERRGFGLAALLSLSTPAAGLAEPLVDRLRLDGQRLASLQRAVREIVGLDDPVGAISELSDRLAQLRHSHRPPLLHFHPTLPQTRAAIGTVSLLHAPAACRKVDLQS